jgi:hypothetical protein
LEGAKGIEKRGIAAARANKVKQNQIGLSMKKPEGPRVQLVKVRREYPGILDKTQPAACGPTALI